MSDLFVQRSIDDCRRPGVLGLRVGALEPREMVFGTVKESARTVGSGDSAILNRALSLQVQLGYASMTKNGWARGSCEWEFSA